MRFAAVCLVVGALLTGCSSGPGDVAAAGSRYTVTVLPTDPVEVRVTSGMADTVTLAAVMPDMGHAWPPVDTVRIGSGRFVATADVFVMDGAWELSVSLSGDDGDEVLTVLMVV